jgi:50S ribosomal protein L16 3-hydroxylase
MTFSLGCRAPSVAEIVAHFAEAVIEQASEGERYEDPDLLPPVDRDCIDRAAVARVGRLLAQRLTFDEHALAQHLASLLTRPKALFAPEEHERLGLRAAARAVGAATGLVRRTGSRWLVCPLGDSLHLFVDGEELAVPAGAEPMARELCRDRVLSAQRVHDFRAQPACAPLLVELVARGSLVPDGVG